MSKKTDEIINNINQEADRAAADASVKTGFKVTRQMVLFAAGVVVLVICKIIGVI